MEFLKLKLFVFALFAAACSGDGELTIACDVADIPCLRKSTQNFLEKTCLGIPAYDILAIDPLHISTINYTMREDKKIKHHLSDCTVIGYKNQQVDDFKMNVDAKTCYLKVQADLQSSCNLIVEFGEENAIVDVGPENLTATIILETTYPYTLRTDDKGVEYFEVGQEEIKCQPTSGTTASFTFAPGALEKFGNRKEYITAHEDELVKKSMCFIGKETYRTVVHNLRASGRILPKTAFFKNL